MNLFIMKIFDAKINENNISTLVSASLFLSNFSYLKSQEINKNTFPLAELLKVEMLQ